MVKLASTLSRLNPTKVMVIGDLLVDTYTIGKARRISPEAPVAVVLVQNEESRPGGSGNVVLNLLSLGSQVVVIGRIGKDWAGDCLCDGAILSRARKTFDDGARSRRARFDQTCAERSLRPR